MKQETMQMEGWRRLHGGSRQAGIPGAVRRVCALALLALAAGGLSSCGGGSSAEGVGIQNALQSAPHLEEFDAAGNYRPYYATGDFQRPRYMHEAVFSQSGFVVAFGGSDERGLTALDNVEFFDQSTVAKDTPPPQSKAGFWFDTNFEGDPMTFETGPRILFTTTELADGRIICIGGSSNILFGPVRSKAEIFDPTTRVFETLKEEMIDGRFKHTTFPLSDGSLLVVGGQSLTQVTIVQQLFFANVQMQITVFPSLATCEIYSPTENAFLPFNLPDSDRPVRLTTPRGRSGHGSSRLAGPDLKLGSGDDIFIITGGIQTLSPQFAPDTKLPRQVAMGFADGLKSLEFFDAQTRTFTQVGNVALGLNRVEFCNVNNLGLFNDFTIDGVEGMGNAILVCGGHEDDTCTSTINNFRSEVFVASYTGFGPAQGLQFFHTEDVANFGHAQGSEYTHAELTQLVPPFLPAPDPLSLWVGRAYNKTVPMPRRLAAVEGVPDLATWVFDLAGVHCYPVPGGCVHSGSLLVIDAGCVFDPFYSLPAAQLGLSPRDLLSGRSPTNPLGIVGCWLVMDGEIPTTDILRFGSTLPPRWARKIADFRAYAAFLAIPGEDGILGSPDDRILMAGGGSETNSATPGGEPTAPTCEIFLPPGLNDRQPSP